MSDSLQPPGLYMEFSRSECWSGQPFPSSGNLPNPGIEPRSPALQAGSLPAELQAKPLSPTVIIKEGESGIGVYTVLYLKDPRTLLNIMRKKERKGRYE